MQNNNFTSENDFFCLHCHAHISGDGIGTHHRNHCPHCLHSLHVDNEISGDRAADCSGEMIPIGLTFKEEGSDKYGKEKQGELMIIHRCIKCGKISINRIAADDEPDSILQLLNDSVSIDSSIKSELFSQNIKLLDSADEAEIRTQLFGRSA